MTVSQKLLILLWCVEGNVKFQLEVSENKDIYFLFNFIDPSKTYLRTLESLWTPG